MIGLRRFTLHVWRPYLRGQISMASESRKKIGPRINTARFFDTSRRADYRDGDLTSTLIGRAPDSELAMRVLPTFTPDHAAITSGNMWANLNLKPGAASAVQLVGWWWRASRSDVMSPDREATGPLVDDGWPAKGDGDAAVPITGSVGERCGEVGGMMSRAGRQRTTMW